MLALPLRVVGVLDRELRKLRFRPRAERRVRGVELGEQQRTRCVVGADVMKDDQQQVLFVGEVDQSGPQQRVAAEVEGTAGELAEELRGLRLPLGFRPRA
jgi:hypothetical protein